MDKKIAIIVTVLTVAILGGGVLVTNKIANQPVVVKDAKQLVGDARHTKGNPQAKVTLVEIADFQCPACSVAYPFVKAILEAHKDNLYFVYRDFPLSQHKNSFNASEAAEGASEQGKYWKMFDLLYSKQNDWQDTSKPVDKFSEYAKELGLDTDKFKKSLEEHKFKNNVEKDLNEVTKLGITATPTFFINGQQFTGEFKDLKSAVEQKMLY